MKCHILFSVKSKKNIINLSSAELAQRVVKVKIYMYFPLKLIFILWYMTLHYNLFITLLLGSTAKMVLAKQRCCIQTKFSLYRKMTINGHLSI